MKESAVERVSRNFSKNRLQPYKLLALLLYGNYEWAVWRSPDTVEVKTGPLSRLIGVSYGKLREHIDWLVARGYLTYAATDHGKGLLVVRRPPDRVTPTPTPSDAPKAKFADPSDAQVQAELDRLDAIIRDTVSVHGKTNLSMPEALEARLVFGSVEILPSVTTTLEVQQKPIDKKKVVW